jgi:hypothetical protein
MGELTLLVLTLFVFTAGTIVLLQGQTDPRDAQRSAVARNSWSKGAAMPKALKFVMTGVIGGKVYVLPVATCDAASGW